MSRGGYGSSYFSVFMPRKKGLNSSCGCLLLPCASLKGKSYQVDVTGLSSDPHFFLFLVEPASVSGVDEKRLTGRYLLNRISLSRWQGSDILYGI